MSDIVNRLNVYSLALNAIPSQRGAAQVMLDALREIERLQANEHVSEYQPFWGEKSCPVCGKTVD